MIIMADDNDITNDFYQMSNFTLQTENIDIRRETLFNTTNVVATFSFGVTVIVHLGVRSLEINLEVDKSLESSTNGLLGNFNERADDEFELPNGTVLPINMTEKDILEKFAALYKVTMNNSIFIYEPGKTTNDYQHPEFVPQFSDRLNQSIRNAAAQICGTNNAECLYDYSVTGDASFAQATKDIKIQVVSNRNFLANTPPTIQIISLNKMINDRWLVQDGVKNVLQLLATDADNDNITYINVYNSTNVTVFTNGTLELVANLSNPVKIGFQARDSKGAYSVVLNIPVTICPSCNGHGMCNSNSSFQSEHLNGTFQVLSCVCLPAYTGENCESELDACVSRPCSKGQNCTDLTAVQQGNSTTGYLCGPCPAGFIDANRTCTDINECINVSLCHHVCVNTEGSYRCQCNEGYNLSTTDNRSCLTNTPPTIQIISLNKIVNGRWLVQDRVKNVLQLLATDADNDNITYINVYNSTSVIVSANGTVEFVANLSNPVKLGFMARDSKGAYSAILNIPVTICPSCNGHGMCTSNSSYSLTEYLNGTFQVQKCVCYPAYSGLYCDTELDACQSNPCSKGRICTDLTAVQQGNSTVGYVCGPCPPGFIDVNITCIDINECSNLSLCHQICVNTEGSYRCQCYEGYNISIRDNRTCTNFTCSNCNWNKTLTCNPSVESCICQSGWTGQYCNVILSPCNRNSCQNGLLCVETVHGHDCLCYNSAQPSASGTCEDCNRTITSSGGVIMSTNYPLNYPNDAHCTWTILSNQTGAIVTLNITEYDVEGCPYDYLTIYDGNSSRASLIGQFCNSAPGLITSSGGALHLVFVSDDSISGKGFIGTYTVQTKCKLKNCSHSCEVISTNPRIEQCVCPEWSRLDPNNSSRCVEINACNITITSSSGYIVSPGYPNLYPLNTTCYWIVSTSSTKQILLSFSDLKIEESTNCAYDYIKVLDGNSLQSQTLGQFCGNNLPVSLRSHGPYMYILFKSDDSIAGRGFNVQFSTVEASSTVLQLSG